jgi:hypothetical protein
LPFALAATGLISIANMACFAGCFSRDVAGSADQQSKQAFYASGASADASGTFGANTSLPAASQQSQKGCRGSLDPFSGGSGNKKHAPPSRSASSSSGSWDSTSSGSSAGSCRREELREACLAYGSNIMAVSTLQQDKLEYFVIPGEQLQQHSSSSAAPCALASHRAVGRIQQLGSWGTTGVIPANPLPEDSSAALAPFSRPPAAAADWTQASATSHMP